MKGQSVLNKVAKKQCFTSTRNKIKVLLKRTDRNVVKHWIWFANLTTKGHQKTLIKYVYQQQACLPSNS